MLDATKIIPEEDVPVRPIGRLVLDRVVDNFFAETEQVAFCTQNVVPGIDFTNDPLLQGRNFSYLDTQLKRLGGPNFTQLPINAPKCPVAHFQQDGHMAYTNPVGRANYEPNSWPLDEAGPREDPARGFHSMPVEEHGEKRRVRAEMFADHYSQARQFYVSQMPIEQEHIVKAFVFELSKVERPDIRRRMVANLRNVDEDLAAQVADGLGLRASRGEPAGPPADRRPAGVGAPQHRRQRARFVRGPQARRAGDRWCRCRASSTALREGAGKEGAVVEVVAPKVGGVELSDGSWLEADQKIDGGPSVLYDAVVLLTSDTGVAALVDEPAARDFVSDAFAHSKFVAHDASAGALLDAAGVQPDDGFVALTASADVDRFIQLCRGVRFWSRSPHA